MGLITQKKALEGREPGPQVKPLVVLKKRPEQAKKPVTIVLKRPPVIYTDQDQLTKQGAIYLYHARQKSRVVSDLSEMVRKDLTDLTLFTDLEQTMISSAFDQGAIQAMNRTAKNGKVTITDLIKMINDAALNKAVQVANNLRKIDYRR